MQARTVGLLLTFHVAVCDVAFVKVMHAWVTKTLSVLYNYRMKCLSFSLRTTNDLTKPNSALLLSNSAVLLDKVEQVSILTELHKQEVFVLPLQNAVNTDQVLVVDATHNFNLTWKESDRKSVV